MNGSPQQAQSEILFLLYNVNANKDRTEMVKILGFPLRGARCSHPTQKDALLKSAFLDRNFPNKKNGSLGSRFPNFILK
jgi:hypothetical protein